MDTNIKSFYANGKCAAPLRPSDKRDCAFYKEWKYMRCGAYCADCIYFMNHMYCTSEEARDHAKQANK